MSRTTIRLVDDKSRTHCFNASLCGNVTAPLRPPGQPSTLVAREILVVKIPFLHNDVGVISGLGGPCRVKRRTDSIRRSLAYEPGRVAFGISCHNLANARHWNSTPQECKAGLNGTFAGLPFALGRAAGTILNRGALWTDGYSPPLLPRASKNVQNLVCQGMWEDFWDGANPRLLPVTDSSERNITAID